MGDRALRIAVLVGFVCLVVLGMAALFQHCYIHYDSAFATTDGVDPHDFGRLDWLYFSVVTITTTGYGEIFPARTMTRLAVCLERLLSVYLVVPYLGAVILQTLVKGKAEVLT